MPLGPEVANDALAAVLFMQSSMSTLDAYSTLLSSPWTAESFGADERRSRALKEYLTHAVSYSMGYAIMAAMITRSVLGWWILASAMLTNGYLIWLYTRASKRGREAGSDGWVNP